MAPSPQFQASMDLVAALRTRDVAKVMAFLADDAVLLPPGRDLVGGRRDIEAALKDFLGKNTLELAFSSLGSAGAAGLGFDVGQYELTLKPEGGTKTKTRGKYLVLFRQNAEEKWRLAYLSWNGSDPQGPPAPVPSPTPTPTPTPGVK